MKESKLLKEVVRRSVEPELNSISERILDDNKIEDSHPSVTIKPRYLTRFVACLAIVFSLGLITGLVLTKNILRKGPEPNAAPKIIDTNSKASDISSESLSPESDFNAAPYLKYNSEIHYSYGISGTKKTFKDIFNYSDYEGFINYLSTLDFIGITGDKFSVLSSNIAPEGSPVFRTKNGVTYYVYTHDGAIYMFGRCESPDLNTVEQIKLPTPDYSTGNSLTYVYYNDIKYPGTVSMSLFDTQKEMLEDTLTKEYLKDAVFLGTTPSENLTVRGFYVKSKSPVFYSRYFRCFFTVYYESEHYHLNVLNYQGT